MSSASILLTQKKSSVFKQSVSSRATASLLIRTIQTNLKTELTKTGTLNNCHVRTNAD